MAYIRNLLAYVRAADSSFHPPASFSDWLPEVEHKARLQGCWKQRFSELTDRLLKVERIMKHLAHDFEIADGVVHRPHDLYEALFVTSAPKRLRTIVHPYAIGFVYARKADFGACKNDGFNISSDARVDSYLDEALKKKRSIERARNVFFLGYCVPAKPKVFLPLDKYFQFRNGGLVRSRAMHERKHVMDYLLIGERSVWAETSASCLDYAFGSHAKKVDVAKVERRLSERKMFLSSSVQSPIIRAGQHRLIRRAQDHIRAMEQATCKTFIGVLATRINLRIFSNVIALSGPYLPKLLQDVVLFSQKYPREFSQFQKRQLPHTIP